RHPLAALVTSLSVLGVLAIPAADLHVANISSGSDLPSGIPAVQAMRAVEHAFPGSHDTVELVLTGRHLDGSSARAVPDADPRRAPAAARAAPRPASRPTAARRWPQSRCPRRATRTSGTS